MAQSLHRRVVLKSSVLSSAAILVTQRAQAVAANDTLTIALIGAGGQGRNHLKSYVGQSDVRIAYVCDVDEQHLDEARKIAPKAKAVSDLRRVLDDREVDAVAIATPDHWHTPAALLALAAGKHVYVEKPCSHNVREGRMLVAAAEKHRRVVQHGTQSRSNAFIQDSIKLLREGVIGKVIMARAWNVQFRPPIGHAAPSSPPATLDYDTWVGPAAFLPYQANRQHYTWHWWYNFGTGDAGNDGVHEIDIARWGLGVETHPQRIMAAGGKYVHDDDQQFPDTLTAVFDYSATGGHPARQLTFEMRLWDRNSPYGIDNGNEFLGTEGRMLLTKRGKVEVYDKNGKKKNVSLPKVEAAGIQPHQRNFISTIRGETKANADALTGHLSSSLPHLANIACRVGRGLVFDPTSETIQGDQQANELLGREYRQDYWATPKRS